METLFFVIPAYNEEQNIKALFDDWNDVLKWLEENSVKTKFVFINDGSTDDTLSILSQMAKVDPIIEVIDKKNGGHGSAVIQGYKYVIDKKADWVFQIDSDRQTDSTEFMHFWKLRYKYDAIIGKRSKREDGKSRLMVEKVLCTILYMVFGVRVPDANAPFRLMRRELLSKYIVYLRDDYALPNALLTAIFAARNERIAFCEISFCPRRGGTNNINLMKIIKIGIKETIGFMVFKKSNMGILF